MDFGLKDFASTLAVGGYTLVAIGLLLWLCACGWVITWVIKQRHCHPWTTVSIAAISCFVLGILVEDTSDEYYANRPGSFLWLIPQSLGLHSEDDLKAAVLFKDNGTLTGLGDELHALGALQIPSDHKNKVAEAKNLYYFAKGVVYRDTNYYNEMRRIQLRINFVRSIALVSLLGVYACSILIVQSFFLRRIKFGKCFIALLSFGALMLLAHVVFAIEETQFNARAYGYWATMEKANWTKETPVLPGISGMARLGSRSFVVVHDRKSNDPRPRVGRLYVDPAGCVHYKPFAINWEGAGGLPSDLESICPIPGRAGEFLAAESSGWIDRTGRVFHLAVDGTWCQVIGVSWLPDVKNVEGVACEELKDDTVVVTFGERAPEAGTGKLYRCVLNLADHSLREVTPIKFDLTNVPKIKGLRVCSDLYFDEGDYWVSAAVDPDVATGPFESFVYKLDLAHRTAQPPTWRLDGLKVEALGPAVVEGSALSVATDDEDFGGIWRPLPPR